MHFPSTDNYTIYIFVLFVLQQPTCVCRKQTGNQVQNVQYNKIAANSVTGTVVYKITKIFAMLLHHFNATAVVAAVTTANTNHSVLAGWLATICRWWKICS